MSAPFQPTPVSLSPTVSVVLPTFNRLQYLREAVESVFAQTFTAWELLIGDDGSDGETLDYLAALADRPRVKVLRFRHTGNPASVRNATLREARGGYIAFLDSDDLWLPEKLTIQLGALRDSVGRRWNYTAVRRVGPDGQTVPGEARRRWVPYEGAIFEQLLTLEAAVATPSVMAERSLIEEAGAFDEKQRYFEEYDLWLRLSGLSDVGVVRQPLTLVRDHDSHYSADRVGVYQARSRLLEKIGTNATTERLRSALRVEQAKNAIWLSTAYARCDRRTQAFKTLWHSRKAIWHSRPSLWRPAGASVARALAPAWMHALLARRRRRRTVTTIK